MGRPKKQVSEEKIEKFQRELELAGNRTDILLKDKKGRSRSCLLCRRRKQKCDHKLPSCTACLKAGVKCIQPARYQNSKNNQVNNNNTNGSLSNDDSGSSTPSGNITNIPELNIPAPENIGNNNDNSKGNNINNMVEPKLLAYKTFSDTVISTIPNPAFNIATTSQNTDIVTQNKVTKPNLDSQKDEYTKLLEKKLRYLERLIDISPNTLTFKKKIKQYKKITHLLSNMNDKVEELDDCLTTNLPVTNMLKNNISINPNRDNNTTKLPPPPAEFFSINGDSNLRVPNTEDLIPKNYNYDVGSPLNVSIPVNPNISINNKHDAITELIANSLKTFDFSTCIFAKYNLHEFLSYKPALDFDEELSRSFLDTFFTRLQFKYPLLDEQEIYSFHEHFVNNDIYSYSETDFHFACGRMWLVYTISACLHMTTGKYKGKPPMCYFSTAIRHIAKCGKNLNYVQQIELLTLLVLYLLRTDKDSLVLYEIIKDIMIICKEKLYLNKWHSLDPFANKKLRLFWCVYLLERMICVAVGKPYTISESEIDLPYFNENSFNTKDTKIHKGVHFINQSLELRRTESRFVEQLCIIPQKPGTNNNNNKSVLIKQLPQVRKIFKDLEVWRSGVATSSFKNFENETLKLYYYRAVRLLIQPYLEILTPEDRLFRECQAAAGQICQLYKIFHQKTITGHSTPAVHTVFVAGVTLIYCMWLARNFDDEKRRKLGDDSKHTRPLVNATLFSTMDDLRACSVCLYVMTERSNFARIFRDAFDQLMNATMGNLIERCGPNSSELIYMSSDNKRLKHKHPASHRKNSKNSLTSDENSDHTKSYDSGNKMNNENNTTGLLNNGSKLDTNDNLVNGMPPAIKRTFGKGQAEEHAGFVENSQVDLDEQMELNRKRGMLEKATVPKSLAHLLINEDVSGTKNIEKTHIGSPQQKSPIIKTEEEDKLSHTSSNGDDFKRYIVKKPINFNEFDWENFEHQAFLQQHFAQQNLQAYLTSLNYNNTNNNNDNNNKGKSENVDDVTTTKTSYPLTSPVSTAPINPMVLRYQSPQQRPGEMAGMNYQTPNFEQQGKKSNDNSNVNGVSLIPISPVGNIPVPPSHLLPNMDDTTSAASAVANEVYSTSPTNNGYIPFNIANNGNTRGNSNDKSYGMTNNNSNTISANNQSNNLMIRPPEADSSGVLFNNGTHDMINNISTWTNDSVTEILSHGTTLNVNMFPATSVNTNNNNNNNNNNTTMNGVPSQAQNDNNISGSNSNGISNSEQTSGNPMNCYINDGNRNNISNNGNVTLLKQNPNISPVTNNGTIVNQVNTMNPNNNINMTNNINTNNNVNNVINYGNRFPGPSGHAENFAPVEDFWTVNDDYGFLT